MTNTGNDTALAISLIVIFAAFVAAFVLASLALAWRDARTHESDTTEREEYD